MLKFEFIYGENGYKITKELREKIFAGKLKNTTDDRECDSYHLVGYEEIRQMGIARMSEVGNHVFEVSFVGLEDDYRRQMVGDLVMRALVDKAKRLGGEFMIVKSPQDVKGFFEFEGYSKSGDEFTEDGITYIPMRKDLSVQEKCRGCKG